MNRWIVRWTFGGDERVFDEYLGRPLTRDLAQQAVTFLSAIGGRAQMVFVP